VTSPEFSPDELSEITQGALKKSHRRNRFDRAQKAVMKLEGKKYICPICSDLENEIYKTHNYSSRSNGQCLLKYIKENHVLLRHMWTDRICFGSSKSYTISYKLPSHFKNIPSISNYSDNKLTLEKRLKDCADNAKITDSERSEFLDFSNRIITYIKKVTQTLSIEVPFSQHPKEAVKEFSEQISAIEQDLEKEKNEIALLSPSWRRHPNDALWRKDWHVNDRKYDDPEMQLILKSEESKKCFETLNAHSLHINEDSYIDTVIFYGSLDKDKPAWGPATGNGNENYLVTVIDEECLYEIEYDLYCQTEGLGRK
jgi:hypothetical protein